MTVHEQSRIENHVLALLFDDHARLQESAAHRGRAGQVTIILDREPIGTGETFRDALRSALQTAGRTSTGSIRQASSLPTVNIWGVRNDNQ